MRRTILCGVRRAGIGYPLYSCRLRTPFRLFRLCPLCFYGWGHETTAAAVVRNREGVAKFTDMVGHHNAGVKDLPKTQG
jgi:hypothetical protein